MNDAGALNLAGFEKGYCEAQQTGRLLTERNPNPRHCIDPLPVCQPAASAKNHPSPEKPLR